MSRGIEVRVERSNFTPRDEVTENRFNILLEFEVSVPSNSYVFIGGMTRGLGSWLSSLQSKIEQHARGLKPVDENTIMREFGGLFEMQRLRGVTEFLKYGQNYAIPGSSLKGAIRSRVEYKFKLFQVGAEYRSYSCYVAQNPWPSSPTSPHVKFWGEDVIYTRPTCFPPQVCAVCDLFGCPSLSSRVHFTDALMTAGQVQYVNELRREAALPGSKFKTSVHLMNSDFSDLGLLFLGMEHFTSSPILIGAFKYRFNEKLGRERLRNRYSTGLLRFELQSFKPLLGDFPSDVISCNTLINRAREKLLEKYGNYVDIQRGVLP
ncbi:MAG: RAMP superfamily CRISPR-associated protein [Thermoproteota archaeon]